MTNEIHDTALKIVGMSDRGEVTMTGVETVLADFVARGIAAQKAVDAAIAAAQPKPDAD